MYTVKEGDILFYHSTGTWLEQLVVAATSNGDPHADFVHVAIVDTLTDGGRDGTIIEATWRGIVKSPLPSLTSNRIVIYPLTPASPSARDVALNSARSKIGWCYGVADIVSQLLRLLRLPFRVARLRSLDCSHLAAEYAAWATLDATLYGMVCDDGADISPNDLARYYGLVSGVSVKLTAHDAQALMEALDNPKPPSPKLIEAAERYKTFMGEEKARPA